MPNIKPLPNRHSQGMTRPSCHKCQALMEPASLMPGLGHLADRVFECSKCGHIQITPL